MTPNDLLNANMLADINISFTSTLYAMLSSIISAAALRKAYILYGRSMNNREYFGNIFVLLAITTCTVIIIVKYSLALSLGLVGALSIVRFRAAIKEPEELVYLFLTIAFGLAFGASQFAVGFSLLFVSLIVIFVANRFFRQNSIASHIGMLCVVSGNRRDIVDFKTNHMEGLISGASLAILKDFQLEGEVGRVVIKLSSGDKGDELINRIEKSVNSLRLDMHVISEISVPA